MLMDSAFLDVKLADGSIRVRAGRNDRFWNEAAHGRWETSTLSAIEKLSAGVVYVDVGAWIGPTVLMAARRASRVIAYEPDPVAYAELADNVLANDCDNVELRQIAIFDRDGSLPFGGGMGGELGESQSSLVLGESVINVTSVDVRREVKCWHFENCGFLKIDIEGAEYVVVPLMRDYLKRVRPIVLLSLHQFSNEKSYLRQLVSKFRELGARARLLFVTMGHYEYAYISRRGEWVIADAAARLSLLVPRNRNNVEILFSKNPISFSIAAAAVI